MLKQLSRVPLVLWLLVISVIVNIVQFPITRDSAGKGWGAIYTLEEPNMFNVFESLEKRPTVFNVYTAIGNDAPGVTLVTDRHNLFGEKKVGRYMALSVGKVKSIVFTDLDLERFTGFATNLEENKVNEGLHWVSVPQRNRGTPPLSWSIHLHNDNPETLVFISNGDDSRWWFIDMALFDSELQKEIFK